MKFKNQFFLGVLLLFFIIGFAPPANADIDNGLKTCAERYAELASSPVYSANAQAMLCRCPDSICKDECEGPEVCCCRYDELADPPVETTPEPEPEPQPDPEPDCDSQEAWVASTFGFDCSLDNMDCIAPCMLKYILLGLAMIALIALLIVLIARVSGKSLLATLLLGLLALLLAGFVYLIANNMKEWCEEECEENKSSRLELLLPSKNQQCS